MFAGNQMLIIGYWYLHTVSVELCELPNCSRLVRSRVVGLYFTSTLAFKLVLVFKDHK
jgi:hypothetical protein